MAAGAAEPHTDRRGRWERSHQEYFVHLLKGCWMEDLSLFILELCKNDTTTCAGQFGIGARPAGQGRGEDEAGLNRHQLWHLLLPAASSPLESAEYSCILSCCDSQSEAGSDSQGYSRSSTIHLHRLCPGFAHRGARKAGGLLSRLRQMVTFAQRNILNNQ